MRLVDALWRQGHLSEQALADALLTGERPPHLDGCDVCTERAVELGRWLDQIRTIGLDAADAAFPPERLAVQQTQILRRLEQLDQPARVIAFPSFSRPALHEARTRGVAPRWVALAAAAGLLLGLIGGQLTAGIGGGTTRMSSTQQAQSPSLLDFDLEQTAYPLTVLDEMTPRAVDTISSNRAGG